MNAIELLKNQHEEAKKLFNQIEAAGDERSVDKALNKVRGSMQHHLGAEIR